MSTTVVHPRPRGLAPMLGWPRLRFTLLFSLAWGLMLSFDWETGPLSVIVRTMTLGITAMLVFGLFEQWPRRLPSWLARWVLQVVSVGLVMPPTTAIIYWLSTPSGAPPFYDVPVRMDGFTTLVASGVLLGPWAALAALVRQKEAWARHQASAFDLERSELERQALDARLRLLQAQVAPHFLFNTLANVQALVDTGSPRASTLLRSLIAYLRAAVPQLDKPMTTIGHEIELVRAYLELMHMRMPDRLQFSLHAEDSAAAVQCPPIMLLTLVENAVRHGIDPSEEGGSIDVRVERRGDRCLVQVRDTGAGLREASDSGGTGLSNLRERLELAFEGDVQLRLIAQHPRGVNAELDFPAKERKA